MPRAPDSQSVISTQHRHPIRAPEYRREPGEPRRWSLVCRTVSGQNNNHRGESAQVQCRPAAFRSGPTWPPVGLAAGSDPTANWIARFKSARPQISPIIGLRAFNVGHLQAMMPFWGITSAARAQARAGRSM